MGNKLSMDKGEDDVIDESNLYHLLVGCLMYAMLTTRPV